MKLKTILDRIIDWGAALPATPWQLGSLFAFTVILRNLLEAIPDGIVFAAPAFLLHFPVAYVFPMLTLVFLMHKFSGYNTAKLLRIMVLAWVLTLIPPIIDGVLGTESNIGYFPLEKSNAAWFLLNFFNPFVRLSGTTAGIRIEAAIGCVLAGVFTWAVAPKKRLLRGFLNTIVFAPVFLTFFTWPYLVALLFQLIFPGNGVSYNMLQFHAVTEEPLTGALHYTTYLVDMIPVSFLSLWFVKTLSPEKWKELTRRVKSVLIPGIAAFIGSVAAVAVVPGNGITFADSVSLAGGLFAALWLAASSAWKGSFRGVATGVALTLAWAVGWPTLVAALAAAATAGLPLPRRLRIPLFSVSLLLLALSPAGFALFSASTAVMVAAAAVAAWLTLWKKQFGVVFAIPLIVALLTPPHSAESGYVRGLERYKDTFSRSGRIKLAMAIAEDYVSAGGSWLTLAETTHMLGMNSRSRYISETAAVRGDSSTALMKVAMNLAFTRGDTVSFNSSLDTYISSATATERSQALGMRITLMAMNGDTTALSALHSRAGMNPMLTRAFATAHLANGDTLQALQYTMAFLGSPVAAPEDWAKAMTISALTGGENWDSLYAAGERIHGRTIQMMLARLRAPVIAGEEPDRRDLLHSCMVLQPGSREVLETAALWHSAAGNPDSALILSSRVLASSRDPERRLFATVLRNALAAGNTGEATAAAEYAVATYPQNMEFRAYLGALRSAAGEEHEDSLLEATPWASALSDSLKTVICQQQLR